MRIPYAPVSVDRAWIELHVPTGSVFTHDEASSDGTNDATKLIVGVEGWFGEIPVAGQTRLLVVPDTFPGQ